jgi:hypothetical protein
MHVQAALAALGFLITVSATDVLSSSGFQTCGNGTQDVTVSNFQISFDRSTNELTFDVAGDSKVSQDVTGKTIGLFGAHESYDYGCCIRRDKIYQFF